MLPANDTGLHEPPSVTNHRRYQVLREIGVGGFGVVDACVDQLTGETVAMKTIRSDKVGRESKRVLRELDVMLKLSGRHPNIMSLVDAYPSFPTLSPTAKQSDEFDLHLIMPLMQGDLHRFIRNYAHVPVPDPLTFCTSAAVVFAFCLTFAIDYLHQCNIVHRDIKPDNVLLRIDTENVFGSEAVLADFGLARACNPSDTFYLCTRQYRPPEVITNTARGEPALDIWSLGCVLYEIATGTTLFQLPSSLEDGRWVGVKASYQLEAILDVVGSPSPKSIAAIQHPNVRSYLSQTKLRPSRLRERFDEQFVLRCSHGERNLWFELLEACLQFDPKERVTASELCRFGLFRRYNIFVGDNVHQYEPIEYKGGLVSSVRHENKLRILELLQQQRWNQTTEQSSL